MLKIIGMVVGMGLGGMISVLPAMGKPDIRVSDDSESRGVEIDSVQWEKLMRQEPEAWLKENMKFRGGGDDLRSLHEPRESSGIDDRHQEFSFTLLLDVVRFLRGFDTHREKSLKQEATMRWIREISDRWPGVAWVALYRRTRDHLTDETRLKKDTLGFGVQIPLLGERAVGLRTGEWQWVVRLYPIAGIRERITVGDIESTQIRESAIGLRFLAETEARIRLPFGRDHAIEPGIRIFLQSPHTSFRNIRTITEVFIRTDIYSSHMGVRSVKIIPRCAWERVDISFGEDSFPHWSRHQLGEFENHINCTVSTSVAW